MNVNLRSGVIAWTRSIAYAWGKHNITANVVNPAVARTLQFSEAAERAGAGQEDVAARLKSIFPLGSRRFGPGAGAGLPRRRRCPLHHCPDHRGRRRPDPGPLIPEPASRAFDLPRVDMPRRAGRAASVSGSPDWPTGDRPQRRSTAGRVVWTSWPGFVVGMGGCVWLIWLTCVQRPRIANIVPIWRMLCRIRCVPRMRFGSTVG